MTTSDDQFLDASPVAEDAASTDLEDGSADDPFEDPAPRPPQRRSLRHLTLLLSLLSAVLLILVLADRRPAPRPSVEFVDQGGLAPVTESDVAMARAKAISLDYPTTIVFTDRRAPGGEWDRSLNRLAQPNRLVIGIAVEDRAIIIARGAGLPLTASEELAIAAAARAPLRAGDIGRALDYALIQAALLGSPYPPDTSPPLVDAVAVQLALSLIAPSVVLALVLSGLRRRVRARLS